MRVQKLKIGILEPSNFSEMAIEVLEKCGHISKFDGRNLELFLQDVQVLFVRLSYHIDFSFLNLAPKLQYVCSPTTGHNHLDVGKMKERGISLISLRGHTEFLHNIRATPEHTFGLILALLRNYKIAFSHVGNGEWNRDKVRGEERYRKKVGIIGLGRVGKIVSQYCNIFGAIVSFYDIETFKYNNKLRKKNSVASLIEDSDIVVLCASHNKDSNLILGKNEIKLLSGKFFVNTARGELVDESCLIEAIRSKHFAGVAIDVISKELTIDNVKIWQKLSNEYDNLIVTPHISGATIESMRETELFIANELLREINS